MIMQESIDYVSHKHINGCHGYFTLLMGDRFLEVQLKHSREGGGGELYLVHFSSKVSLFLKVTSPGGARGT